LIAFGYWKRRGVRTGNTFAVKPEPKSMPPLRVWPGLLPLARHYSSRKFNIAFLLGINIISLGRDYCLIVDSFKKNYRDKKTRQGDKKEIGREGDGETVIQKSRA
jgi:hypothetical protein